MSFSNVFEEIKLNKQIKIKFLLLLFRISSYRYKSKVLFIALIPFHVIYYIYSHFLLGVEIPASTKIGLPLVIWHGVGIVINSNSIIGKYITLRSGVVIGNDGSTDLCPTIEDGCFFGANAVVVGDVVISKNSKLGPCTFVNFNVNEFSKVINCTIVK
jgi:putative colanic acid biosynthesis acetyltransferase WcaB